jgi:[ribosomal protein S18]-alanine N-acetyltransferase
MSRWTIAPMSQADAEAVATWHYPGEYAFYDADYVPAGLAELLDPQLRGDAFFAARGHGGELEGFVELKPRDGGEVEIGLGLRPDLTGRGLGAAFTAAAIELARGRGAERITLVVAAFNLRATRVYARAGFIETGRHTRHIAGLDWEFVDMELASEPGTGGA